MLDDIKKRKNDFKMQLESDLKKQDDPAPITNLISGANDAVNKALGQAEKPRFIPVDSQRHYIGEPQSSGMRKQKEVVPSSAALDNKNNKEFDDYLQELYKVIDKDKSPSKADRNAGKLNF